MAKTDPKEVGNTQFYTSVCSLWALKIAFKLRLTEVDLMKLSGTINGIKLVKRGK